MDLLKNFDEASHWASEKVAGAVDHLDDKTPCEQWDVRMLINHMCDSQQYFIGKAKGEDAAPPSPNPPELVGSDPVLTYNSYSAATIDVYRDPQAQENEGVGLGISFVDQLVHGWDLAKATGQDTAMPEGLADTAWQLVEGRLTDDKRGAAFQPAIATAPDLPAQDKLLSYMGRNP
ncbi:MAG: TIGR03086 family protein [Actinobacteria bacterium]|nr:TIGR03086 family protein [Actinomycetota bacterium]